MKVLQLIPLVLLSWLILNVLAERRTYIVHIYKTSMPKAFSSHHFWYSSTLQSINSLNGQQLRTEARLHIRQCLPRIQRSVVETLKKSPGFISAYEDDIVIPDTTHSSKFLGLNTATGLWPASQYGKDVIIGVIDIGIWPESPSFKDDGMTPIAAKWKGIRQSGHEFNSSLCNKKLIGARYINEGYRTTYPHYAITMNSARDEDGHGTHVASIAAGNYVDGVSFYSYAPGTVRGVAPRARLAGYKVLWGGSNLMSDTLAGMDHAVADGVDIISISFSHRRLDFYDNPLAIAGFGAREKGILVSLSAGNNGPSIAIIRSGIPWAVVVAARTIDRWFAGTLTLGNGRTIARWSTFPARANVRNLPLVYNETISACNSTELLAEASYNSIIICNQTYETAEFSDMMGYLSRSHVQAAVIISEDLTILQSSSFRWPGVVITPNEARVVINYARTINSSNSPTASINFLQTNIGTEPRGAPALAEFSSRGPARSYQGILKPDIMAPGVLILAAFNPPVSGSRIGEYISLSSEYTLLSGTSMACPHISGVAALLKGAHPEWTPAAIQSAMLTTANPLDNTGEPIKDMVVNNQVTTPLGIGSGQVDPNRALDPGLIYDASTQDYVNLVCSMNFTREQTQTIIRSSYNCSNASSDLNYPSFIVLYDFHERGVPLRRKFRRTVTNVGDGAATYRVKVEVPNNSTVSISPKILVFKKKYEKRSYSLTINYMALTSMQTQE